VPVVQTKTEKKVHVNICPEMSGFEFNGKISSIMTTLTV